MPVSENASLRFSGYYDVRDSYYKNIDPTLDNRNSEIAGGRLRYRYRPSSKLDILFGYEHLNEDTEAQTVVPISSFDAGDEESTQDTTLDIFGRRSMGRS